MSHKIFRWFASLFFALTLSLSGFTPALAAPPANDNFANAEAITSLPFSATVDNTDATAELDEPSSCSFSFRSVWYAFTPAENMAVRVDMVGSLVGGIVGIFLASGPGISNLTFLACASSGGSANFQAEAGKTYYLRVDSSFQTGTLQVNLEQITPPTNDNFANAEVIGSLPFSATVDNTDATAELDEPFACSFPFRSVWYAFTPAENMVVRVDMVGSLVGGVVSIFLASGAGISNLTSLGCSNNNSSSNFNVEAGKAYYLQVDSASRQTGTLQVNLEKISPSANEVTIDIKPGRFPNRIKLTKNVCNDDDNLYVAILTTPSFNARTVDASTLQLGDPNLSGKARPVKSRITDVDRDGDKDMALTFPLCKLVTNRALNTSSTELVLTGRTLDGITITGRDSVKVVR